MPLPWERDLGGRIDHRTISSPPSSPATPWATRPSARCGCTCPRLRRRPDRRYPSVYVIQGYTGHVAMWANRSAYRLPFPEAADQLFASGEAPPCIVVYVDAWTAYGGSQFVDSPGTGRYHTYLCDDVVPFVDARYRTLPEAGHRGDPGQVERRVRGHDHPDAAARPVRRPGHPRRRRPLRATAIYPSSAKPSGPCATTTGRSRSGGTTSGAGGFTKAADESC